MLGGVSGSDEGVRTRRRKEYSVCSRGWRRGNGATTRMWAAVYTNGCGRWRQACGGGPEKWFGARVGGRPNKAEERVRQTGA